MRFATFNLFQFVAPGYYWYEREPRNTYSPAEWAQKLAWISQRLQEMDADVVGFQEVFSNAELQTLCAAAGYPHYATVDSSGTLPDASDVYVKSIVALASRHPLENIRTVDTHPDVRHELALADSFHFSRLPVCAEVQAPGIGAVTVYVAHLKSKRASALDFTYGANVAWEERSRDTLLRLSRANIASLLQRGAEATLLYHSISRDLTQQLQQPVVVLGDLNDDQHSTPLAALTMQDRIYSIGGVERQDWPEGVSASLHAYRLNDTFRIAPNMRQSARPFTHIHHGNGNCIDHILVSNALNPENPSAVAEVLDYRVWNGHLDEDGVHNRLQSDHGQVCIDLIPTHDPQNQPRPGKPLLSKESYKLATRQDFIDLAGGVFQSSKHYQQWSSNDKWEQFWAFFFDTAHGWVTSIYGSMPVSELYQKQNHSIEHIIPREFLDRYLALKHLPRHVRYGATVNPFNFAPSERGLNAKRSNFAFDFEGDKIVRPLNLELHTETFDHTGFDADHEWVIPSRNRGDIARALLYMLLVYGIDELYTRHIDTLVHWAKVDAPSSWEIAYNHWVHTRIGIRNPLIDTPDKALLLLNNRELMHSMAVKEEPHAPQ